MVKMYFKSGQGIKDPVDVNGEPIKIGDRLSNDSFEADFPKFYQTFYPSWTDAQIEEYCNQETYLVKYNEQGFFYAEGIKKNLYLHDFRFKYTKIIK